MDKKILAVAVVAVLAIAAVGVYMVGNSNDDDSKSKDVVSAIARVNTDGSGIYLKADLVPSDFYSKAADGTITFKKEAWGGKVFGTPGTSTIQHVQLGQLAEEMGLKYVKYENQSKDSGTIYYVDSVNTYDAAVNKVSAELDGGILWEPQYSMIASNEKYQEFLLTNDLFPGHTCCVIAGSNDFMSKNTEATVAFLAAYVKAMDYINDAKDNPGSAEYNKLLEICMKYTSGLTESQIIDALGNVVYKYSDDGVTGSLDDLVKDIADLETSLEASGSIKKPVTSLGFKDSTEFAEKLVDDSYLKKAIEGDVVKPTTGKDITVVAITGDVHQIGIRVAEELGYFAEYDLNVKVNGVGNGGAVAQDILNGHSDFGFLGAPPLTSNVVNGGYITA